MTYYLDTSAAVKLVVSESGSTALRRWLSSRPDDIASSDLLRTELLRAVRRVAPAAMVQARAVLDTLTLMTLPPSVFERAAMLDPTALRSLDAVHLASALNLGDDLDGLITYDERQAASATTLGISVIAPR